MQLINKNISLYLSVNVFSAHTDTSQIELEFRSDDF